jgi:hypothetical protein
MDEGTPDGPMIAGIVIDPRDARHMYLATPMAGVLETTDQGESWRPLNENVRCDYLPDPYPEIGQDAHQIALAPTNPDRIWQQNHCGIYRLDRRASAGTDRRGHAREWATSASPSSPPRDPTPPGCGRWTARSRPHQPAGAGRLPDAGRRGVVGAAGPGFPTDRAGSRSSARPSA